MAINQEARIPVYLNDEQAKQALKNLTSEAEKWRKKMHQAMAAGDPKGVKQAEREMKKATAAANKLKRETFDVDKVLQNLSRASVADLRKALNRLRSEQRLLNRDTKEYKAISKQIGAIKGEFSKINGAVTQQRGILDRLKGAAGGLLPAFGVTAIIAGIGRLGKSLFNLTSQIQGETIRSVTVFGDQLGYVEQQAEKVAAKMGVTNREFVSMAANTADLLIPLDFTREQAAKMSTEVQGLAGALDEWTAGQIGVTEVSNILTKAMLGENEQLKRLGIAIRKDTEEYRDLVKQKLETENVTRGQAEAMATLELLYKKSADAQAAYLVEGNKLLRFKKSIGLAFKQAGENIAMFFNEAMESSTEKYRDQQREVDMLDKTLVPLLDKYDTLSNKTIPLTATEQEELNGLIESIARIVPGAITQFDEYGKAMGISADRARELVEAQKAMLLVQNADAISDTEKELRKVTRQMDEQKKRIDTMNRETNFGTQISGNQEEWQRIFDGRINDLETLGQKRLGLETLLKTLKGEPLIPENAEEDAKDTEVAVTSLIGVQEQLLGQAKKWPETTEAEIAAKNRRIQTIETEIARLRELGIVKKEAEMPGTNAPDMVQAEEVQMKQANIRAEEIDALKAMEADWLTYQKKMDTEGQKLAENRIEQWEMEAEGYRALAQERIWAAGQIIDMLIDVAGRESKLGKALFLFNKALAIGDVVINTAKANAKAVANSPMTAGMPWVGINTAMAAGSIAAIVGQTVASFSGPGKKQGGWTGPGSDNQVADFVHANEFVVNAKAARNPTIRPLLDIINQAQQAGTVAQLDFSKMIPTGRQSGGYTTTTVPSATTHAQEIGSPDLTGRGGLDEQTIERLTAALDRFEKKKLVVYTELIKKDLDTLDDIEKRRKL